ncbi:hypothetical protein KMS_R35060 [Pseudomonas sp. LRP2-20]|nr:hypothetical protein KMS_R35060 [Pseudomonas sp. LRP2-20]
MSLVTPTAKRLTDDPSALERIWFTRCPVPTASGIAYKLGWLEQEFAADGLPVSTLQEARQLGHHHYDHQLPGLFREGGNVPALAARAAGSPSRLIGLTWIEEWQTILVRPDSGIRSAADLRGKRLALPAWGDSRPGSIARAMSLHGYKGALASAGLQLGDVQLVEVALLDQANAATPQLGLQRLWSGLEYLARGEVDAVYVKGAAAADAARRLGLVVGVDLDLLADPRHRINNGTPRPITVHQRLLDEHFDLVVRFLAQTLRAADWLPTTATRSTASSKKKPAPAAKAWRRPTGVTSTPPWRLTCPSNAWPSLARKRTSCTCTASSRPTSPSPTGSTRGPCKLPMNCWPSAAPDLTGD